MLCVHNRGSTVIYNGHQGNVVGRIRTHFSLNNNRTGALGIKHYSLSCNNWKAKIFTSQLISNLSQSEQELVRILIDNKTGRIAIENAWRTNSGWPVLCKQ